MTEIPFDTLDMYALAAMSALIPRYSLFNSKLPTEAIADLSYEMALAMVKASAKAHK
jgi:hypothetical protein